MLEDVRRTLSHRRETKEQERLKKLEKARRLSYLKVKRLGVRESAEAGLREQLGTELSAYKAATLALRERRQMEQELRRSRGPSPATRLARATRTILYDIPVKSVRVAAKLGERGGLRRAVIGDTRVLFGPTRPEQKLSMSLNELVFGAPTKRPPTGRKSPSIFEVDKDIFKL